MCKAIHYNSLLYVNAEPPQSVSVLTASDTLIVTWEEPLRGLTNDPVLAYKIECSTTSARNDDILYTARSKVTNTTMSITIPVANFISTSLSAYNCCVEAVLETYSSIACTSERSVNEYYAAIMCMHVVTCTILLYHICLCIIQCVGVYKVHHRVRSALLISCW